jgi:hypothetical protein
MLKMLKGINNNMDYFRIWWEQIKGPMNFFDDIKKCIHNNVFCTFLSAPDKLTWHEELREILVNEQINNENYDSKEYLIIDDTKIENNIGDFLFEKCTSEAQKSEYTFRVRKPTLDDFLIQENILNDKIIWVKNISDVGKWKKHLFPKYNKKISGNSVIFILETTDENIVGNEKINVLKYADYVSEYDVHLFASIVAAESANEPKLRRYITFVAENLCCFDVETLVSFISDNDFKDMNIVDAFIRGYKADDDDRSSIERRLWCAQLQVAFPRIEEERLNFVDRHFDQLLMSVPNLKDVEEPYDFELRHMVFLFKTKELIVDKQEYARIRLLHRLRNKLAHMECCNADEMCELLLCNN